MIDALIHALAGAALAAALEFGGSWSIAPVVLVFALLREQAQHRDEGWTGWVTWHRLIEASAWGVGAAVTVVGFIVLDVLARR